MSNGRLLPVLALAVLLSPLAPFGCDQGTESLEDGKAASREALAGPPLAAEGPYSEESLKKIASGLASDAKRRHFERAFRLVFTPDPRLKDPKAAIEELTLIREEAQRFAPFYRVAGYAFFIGGAAQDAKDCYEQAVKIDPNYGDAHYALASILAMAGSDPDAARVHLNRALALGVKDSMNVAGQLARQAGQRRDRELPKDHPPMGAGSPPAPGPDVPTDGEAIPLKLTGIGSAAELERAYAKLQDPALRKSLEKGFRYTFSPKTQFRDRAAAKEEFEKVIAGDASCAAAYRGLAYVLFDTGQAEASVASYRKALQLDPEYGEAHYALSFILAAAPDQHAAGLEHFKRAMALGVPDERKLGERFYPEAK